jgi:hypothetical protein
MSYASRALAIAASAVSLIAVCGLAPNSVHSSSPEIGADIIVTAAPKYAPLNPTAGPGVLPLTYMQSSAFRSDVSDDGRILFEAGFPLGSGSTPPYLHDGSARTLEEIWTVYNADDKHGRTNDLTKNELNDLIEYLRTR